MTEDKILITEWEYDPKVSGFHPDMIHNDHRLFEAIIDFYERKLEHEGVELFSRNY